MGGLIGRIWLCKNLCIALLRVSQCWCKIPTISHFPPTNCLENIQKILENMTLPKNIKHLFYIYFKQAAHSAWWLKTCWLSTSSSIPGKLLRWYFELCRFRPFLDFETLPQSEQVRVAPEMCFPSMWFLMFCHWPSFPHTSKIIDQDNNS